MRRSSPNEDREPNVALTEDAAEAKAAFHLRMRARGVQDLRVLRAFELVPRQSFVPHRYLDLATRGLALPIGCGQTLPEPWLVARMIEVLSVEPTHRVLEIGAGTGYATAILAQLAADVIAFERFQSLAVAGQARLAALGIANAAIVWGDGLAAPASIEVFDRVLVHGLLTTPPSSLMDRLVRSGVMVCARATRDGQRIVKIVRSADDELVETTVCPCRLQPILSGAAATL